MSWIKNAWQGKTPLWQAFWIYWVVGGILLQVIFTGTIMISVIGASLIGIIASALLTLIYVVWVNVSNWRCAFNTKWRGWGYIVRFLVFMTFMAFPVGLVIGGISAGSDLINAAECRVELRKKQEAGENIPDKKEFLHQCITKGQGNQEISPTENGSITESPHSAEIPPIDTAPTMPPIIITAPEAMDILKHKEACEKTMAEHAIAGGADPAAYIAENQEYIHKCIDFRQSENKP